MIDKQIKLSKKARKSIKKGIDLLANSVKVTLGPKGKYVIIGEYQANGKPHITKDGVTVAKSIQCSDKFLNAGVNLIREAALKTVETVGDATTSSTVLAQTMINYVNPFLNMGCNAVDIKKGIDKASNVVLNSINQEARLIKDTDIEKIATISANNDKTIGKLIANTFDQVTTDGIVLVEESSNLNDSVQIVKGMQFENGLLAQHFITNESKGECVLENPSVLITERKINSMMQIKDILEQLVSMKKPILLIAEDFDSAVIENLKYNKLQGVLNVCPVKAPSFGDYRKDILNDIALITNGKVLSYESGLEVNDITFEMLGNCDKVIVNKQTTTIITNNSNINKINSKVEELKNRLEEEKSKDELKSEFVIKFLKTRIARLVGGIARIYIGGATELEMKERRDRVDDSISAVRAAIEEGIVAGGGITYLKAKNELHKFIRTSSKINLAEYVGEQVVEIALSSIFWQIIYNVGRRPKQIYKHINLDKNIGYDANKDEYVEMYKAGIIDPAKAVRLAFINAISVVDMFIMTDSVIVPEKINQLINL